jgi:DNA-binding protein HU-beta
MRKKELIEGMSRQAGVARYVARDFLNLFHDKIKREIRTGGTETFLGFGTFSKLDYVKNISANPRTMATTRPTRIVKIKFEAGSALEDALN